MEKITVYKCDYCGKLIDTQEECAKHEQRHRNVEGANEMLRSGGDLGRNQSKIWDMVQCPGAFEECNKRPLLYNFLLAVL